MKSLVSLTTSLMLDIGEILSINTSRDVTTVINRCLNEGEGFLTKTLPSFEKQLLTAVSRGSGSDLFPGFQKRGGLPIFLSGFLRQIFDTNLSADHRATVLRYLRQILVLHGKIKRIPSEKAVSAAYRAYVRGDAAISTTSASPAVFRAFHKAFGQALHEVERRLEFEPFVGKHGPGAVSERFSQNEKWLFPTWPYRLQEVLPFWDVAVSPLTPLEDLPEITWEEPHSRLVAVPKTAKGPRLIAIEPTAHQFVQQGILRLLQEELSRTRVWQSINWTDQTRNQELARIGSRDHSLATIDLSEASDSVSWDLVRDLLRNHRTLLRWIDACRTRVIDVSGEMYNLRKFASMGSALTFPIETMVFYAIARSTSLGTVSVYGDDIIVPVDDAASTIAALSSHGFKVNVDKTFTHGPFKESCGEDFYEGRPVKATRNKSPLQVPLALDDLESATSLRNAFFSEMYTRSVELMDTWLKQVPFGPVYRHGIQRWSWDFKDYRYNERLQRSEYPVLFISRPKPLDHLEGFAALTKCLTMGVLSSIPLSESHLEREGRPRSGKKKTGWTS